MLFVDVDANLHVPVKVCSSCGRVETLAFGRIEQCNRGTNFTPDFMAAFRMDAAMPRVAMDEACRHCGETRLAVEFDPIALHDIMMSSEADMDMPTMHVCDACGEIR